MARSRPLILHGSRLSLGNRALRDGDEIGRFAAMAMDVDPLWVTARLGFSRAPGTDLGFTAPIPLNEDSLSVVAGHAVHVMRACGKRLLVENIAAHLRFASSMPEPEFLNRLCASAGCGLLLNLTNLFVNSCNHGFDALCWLETLVPTCIRQIHVGGSARVDGCWQVTHDRSPSAEVFALAEKVISMAPVEAAVLERDAAFPPVSELVHDLDTLKQFARSGPT